MLNGKPTAPAPNPPPPLKNEKGESKALPPTESREISGDSAVFSTFRRNVRTLEELLDFMKVDLTEWEVDRYVINKWEVVMREPATTVGGHGKNAVISIGKNGEKSTLWTRGSNVPMHEPLYQVKAWLKRRTSRLLIRSVFDDIFARFRAAAPKPKAIRYPKGKGCMFEIDLFDPHFGKLCWGKETGRDYDLKIASEIYGEAVEGLIHRAAGYKIERIVLPIGNDHFHINNDNNTTAAGTPQDCDGRSHKIFAEGRVAAKHTIDRLLKIAPVDVVMVPGNHDTDTVFYLGEVLQGWYHRTPGVTIDNRPPLRKYVRHGANLIGFTHGNNEKHKDLPLLMATERATDWAATKYREFHIGHYHQLKTISFLPVQEFNSIRVRVLSSLTPPDAWHKKMGYEGLRAAQAFVWDSADGCIGQLSYNAK